MDDEQVLKLYRLIKDDMDALEKRINSRFDAVERQIDDVRGHIDHLYGEQQTREIEESAIGHQLGLHEEWIEQAAPKVGGSVSASGVGRQEVGCNPRTLPLIILAPHLFV